MKGCPGQGTSDLQSLRDNSWAYRLIDGNFLIEFVLCVCQTRLGHWACPELCLWTTSFWPCSQICSLGLCLSWPTFQHLSSSCHPWVAYQSSCNQGSLAKMSEKKKCCSRNFCSLFNRFLVFLLSRKSSLYVVNTSLLFWKILLSFCGLHLCFPNYNFWKEKL